MSKSGEHGERMSDHNPPDVVNRETRRKLRKMKILIIFLVAVVIVLSILVVLLSFALVFGPAIDKIYEEQFGSQLQSSPAPQRETSPGLHPGQLTSETKYPSNGDEKWLDDRENLNEEWDEDESDE